MKTKYNNILWSIFFSWIIICGSDYTSIKCDDLEHNSCCITSSLFSKTETIISSYTNNSHCQSILSNISKKKDFCCKKKERTSEVNPFLSTQNSGFQIHSINFVNTSPRPNNRALRHVLVENKTRQSVPIYTLTQSFLC